jgi:hypothetical protein
MNGGEIAAPSEDWGVDSDEVVERELLPIHLSRAKAKLAGKTVGFPRVPTKEAFLDDELRDGVFGKEVAFKEVLGEAKQADLHQVLLWVASKFSKRQWSSRFKTGLQPLLELGDDDAIVCILEQCFQADKPQTRCCSQQPAGLQPAARRRFAQLLALGLRKGTRVAALEELSLLPAVSLPVYDPRQEVLLKGEGIPVLLNRYPIPGDEFKEKAGSAIRKAGLHICPQRRVLLINEGEKGVGVRVDGRFEPGCFFGFYIGIAGEGHGRFVVSTPGRGVVSERCDAEPCKELPLSWFIENGVPCPFINAADSPAEANTVLYRDQLFYHNWNGKKLICIPMGVRDVIEDASFASWFYSFAAVRGGSMTF